MYFQQDWVLRQIEMLVRFIAKTVLKKDTPVYEIGERENFTDGDTLHRRLVELIAEGKLCEAEDLLYDRMDSSDSGYLSLALDFYDRLNRLSDEELEAGNFSREEINDGVHEIMCRFDIPGLPL